MLFYGEEKLPLCINPFPAFGHTYLLESLSNPSGRSASLAAIARRGVVNPRRWGVNSVPKRLEIGAQSSNTGFVTGFRLI